MALSRRAVDQSRGGVVPWFGQRVTAVLVLVTIGVHLVLTHYVALGELSFANIEERLGAVAVLVNDIVLLVAVVFHGLNGVRMVALDYGFAGAGARRALSAVLIALGVAAIAFGIWALWVWVS